jgi:hypothetical protein
MYTVQKCSLTEDELYGNSHASKDGYDTVCGLEINHHWYIINNTYDGEYNCKKCAKILEENRINGVF